MGSNHTMNDVSRLLDASYSTSPCYNTYKEYDEFEIISDGQTNETFARFRLPRIPSSNASVFCGYKAYYSHEPSTYAAYSSRHSYEVHNIMQKSQDNFDLDRLLFSTFFLIATLIGLIGSILILIAIKQKAIKLDEITTVLIQHIAVVDILATLIVIFPTSLTAITDRWLFGEKFCAIQAYFKWFIKSPGAILVCALNCCKLVYVRFPYRAARWRTIHGHFIAASVWITSGVLHLLFHLTGSETYAEFLYRDLMCSIHIPKSKFVAGMVKEFIVILLGTALVVISGIWLIVMAVRMSRKSGTSVNLQGIVTVILIAGVYCVSFLPYIGFFAAVMITDGGMGMSSHVATFCKSMPYLNNIANALIYMISLRGFRGFVNAKFFGLCSCVVTGYTSLGNVVNITTQRKGSHPQNVRLESLD